MRAALEAIEVIKMTVEALERGIVVPSRAALPVAKALRAYLNGSLDITRNFGLRPRRGGSACAA